MNRNRVSRRWPLGNCRINSLRLASIPEPYARDCSAKSDIEGEQISCGVTGRFFNPATAQLVWLDKRGAISRARVAGTGNRSPARRGADASRAELSTMSRSTGFLSLGTHSPAVSTFGQDGNREHVILVRQWKWTELICRFPQSIESSGREPPMEAKTRLDEGLKARLLSWAATTISLVADIEDPINPNLACQIRDLAATLRQIAATITNREQRAS